MFSYFKAIVLVYCCYTGINSYAFNTSVIEHQADQDITELYHSMKDMPSRSVIDKLTWFSAHFKGRDYFLGSLGEGAHARYDQYPLYRTDVFDCDTYVNTMLALALSDSLASFKHCINVLRYQSGIVSYLHRNHFTSLDWNINNQKRGILKDITSTFRDKKNKRVALYSSTLINKAGWYKQKKTTSIRLRNKSHALENERLAELKIKASHLKPHTAHIAYIPLDALFINNKPQKELFAQIPNGAVIEIIRPNWDLRDQIGTRLDVSHLGFAFWQQGILYFREASSQYGSVVDVPLIDYLQKAKESPTIKGINVQQVIAKATSCKGS